MLNQPERKPDYFIQIPPEVLFETKLSAGAKLFYGEVLFDELNRFDTDEIFALENADISQMINLKDDKKRFLSTKEKVYVKK